MKHDCGWLLPGDTGRAIVGPDVVHGFRNSSGKPARFLSISTQLHQAFFDECAVTAKRDDPIPPFPDGEELQRLLEGAAKHQIYLFEQE